MKITIFKGDIIKIKADAIVNAANSHLVAGGGVDGAIHRVAGPELQKELIKIKNERYPKGLPVGEAIFTKAYNLPSKIIIHAVGPRYYSNDINLLKNCYTNSLKLAEQNNCRTIAFPSISTGAYGVPIEKSADIVNEVITNFNSNILKEVILVLYSENDFEIYKKYFAID